MTSDANPIGGATQAQKFTVTAYQSAFTGGVNLAVGDVIGDGTPDMVAGAGPDGAPLVAAFNGSTGAVLQSQSAFEDTTVSGFAAVSSTAYTFNVTATAAGTVTVAVPAGVATDAAGNANTAGTLTRTFGGTPAVDASGMAAVMPSATAAEWQTQSDGLKIWDVQTGTGAAVASGSTVTVYYTGWLASNGTVFDSNRTAEPISFPLSGVIQGWREGLVGMRVGGIRRPDIPAALGYGSSGAGSIPPNADLVFEVKLVSTT